MGTITMFASGKGGVGKSTMSVYVGAALAASGKKALVIELDSSLRSIDVISGSAGKLIYDIHDVLSGGIDPMRAIVESPLSDKLFVLSAPFAPSRLPVEEFVRLATALTEQFDEVIIDTASSPGAILSAASCAMRAVIVATPDPIGIRYARNLYEQLHEYSVLNIRLLINRLFPDRIHAGIVPDLDYVIDSIGARLIGLVPESLDIALASAGVSPLKSGSFPALVFHHIAERMSGNDLPLLIT